MKHQAIFLGGATDIGLPDLRERLPEIPVGPMRSMILRAIKGSAYTIWEFFGPGRPAGLVKIRFAVYRAARDHGYSLPQIGKVVKRDHTTVMDGLRSIEARGMRDDPEFQRIYNLIRPPLSDESIPHI